MEYIDFKLIINTAIGTAIGMAIAAFPLVKVILQLLEKWPGWKRVGAVALAPFFGIVVLFLVLMLVLALGEKWRVGRQPLYSFSCQNECEDVEDAAAQACAELSILYTNPKRRGDIMMRKDLREIVPEKIPQPSWRGRRGEELRYDDELAKTMFEACMENKGYTTGPCVKQETCYRVRIYDSLLSYPAIDLKGVELIETVDSK